ncbi:glycosyltransferase family 4 protein [Erysipelothrix anatis]|uniref:glycosyltransferase family 4 protein n=1 Tax=Erysipelothrix anatis TaxID=2683713 RepID=UPI00135871D2|nr:glycosyltransferase [Erysipelothrix anatis]
MFRDRKVAMISISDNYDHQNTLYSMYDQFTNDENYICIGLNNPKFKISNEVKKSPRYYSVKGPLRPGVTKGTFNIFDLNKILRILKKEKIKCVYFESTHVWNLPIILYSKMKKIEVYHALHDVIPHDGDSQSYFVKKLQEMIIKLSDMILVRSEVSVPIFKELNPKYSEKCRYLPLWREWNDLTIISESNPNPYLLFFGRLNKYKGLDDLIKIIEMLPDIKFKVVGRASNEVVSEIEALRSFRNVEMDLEYVSDEAMESYFRKANAVILPYQSATQSGVIIDAYNCGTPVIAYDVGAISSQIKHGSTGFLSKPNDVKAMADYSQEMMRLSDKEIFDFRERAFLFGEEQYSSKSKKDQFEKMFSK